MFIYPHDHLMRSCHPFPQLRRRALGVSRAQPRVPRVQEQHGHRRECNACPCNTLSTAHLWPPPCLSILLFFCPQFRERKNCVKCFSSRVKVLFKVIPSWGPEVSRRHSVQSSLAAVEQEISQQRVCISFSSEDFVTSWQKRA